MLKPYLELPRAVHILCIGTLINRAGTFLVPFLTLYLSAQLHLGERFATLTMGLYGLGSIVAALAGGHLADWIGRRTVMLISLFGGAASLLLFSQLTHPIAIMVDVVAFGMIAEMYRPGATAMIGDLVEPARRPHAFGLLYVAINLGFAIGPAIGGVISTYSFRLLFAADAATSVVYGLIVLFAIHETLRRAGREGDPADGDRRHVPLGEAARHMLRDYPFQIFCFAGFLLAVMFMQSMSTFPLYLSHQGIGRETYGPLIALNGVMIVALQLPVTAFLSRFDRATVVVMASLITGIGFALTGVATNVWQYALTIVVWTLGEIMQASFVFAIATDLAPPRMRGRYMGAFGMSFATAMTIGVPLGGEVLSRFGGRWLWAGCLVCSFISAGLYLSVRRHLRPRSFANRDAVAVISAIKPE